MTTAARTFRWIGLVNALWIASGSVAAGGNRVSVRKDQILINDRPVKIVGLRCSNALISDIATNDLIAALDLYRSYGVNAVSVYLMGSRFGAVRRSRSREAAVTPVSRSDTGGLPRLADRSSHE